MGKMSKEEIACLTIFVIATVLAFTRNLYASVLPGLKPAYVFIIAAVLSFLLKDSKGEPILRWKPIQGKVYWSLMYIFAGGLAVGTLLTKTGADVCIGNYVSQMGLTGGFVTVLVITFRRDFEYGDSSSGNSDRNLRYERNRCQSDPLCVCCHNWCKLILYNADFCTKCSGRLWTETFLYV